MDNLYSILRMIRGIDVNTSIKVNSDFCLSSHIKSASKKIVSSQEKESFKRSKIRKLRISYVHKF